MNAWAVTEAYVAFRDRGDVQRAQELKPYVLAMLDNLSWEINNLGIIDDQLGVRDLTYALLVGIWKVARYENEAHPDWESAAWAMWNSGYFNMYSTHSVCIGLYLCVLSGTNYEPPFVRENFASMDEQTKNEFTVFPNPSDGMITIAGKSSDNFNIDLIDINGRILWQRKNANPHQQFDLSGMEPGTYFLRIQSRASGVQTEPILLR